MEHYNFKGTNLIDQNLPLNVSPYMRNVDTENGNIAKCKGRIGLFDSLGASGIKGIYASDLGTFDTLLFGHGTSVYRLSGSEQSITKTLTADFTGTHTNTVANSDKVILSGPGLTVSTITQNDQNGTIRATSNIGQTFKTNSDMYVISSIMVSFTVPENPGNRTLTLYTDTSKTVSLGSVTNYIDALNNTFTFSSPIEVEPLTTYYFELSNLDSEDYLRYHDGNLYSDGMLYRGETSYTDWDLLFEVSSGNQYLYDDTEGIYLTDIIDLGQTPVASILNFNISTTSESNVSVFVKGSSNGETWSNWEAKSNEDSIPLKRYLQLKVILTTEQGYLTPSFNDFTITYTNTFGTATAFDTGLSGDIIRFCDYGGKTYYCDNGGPKSYNGTTVKTLGVLAPETTCTVAIGSGGNLDGTYTYKVTFVDSDGVEGNPSVSSSGVTVSSEKVSITNIPTSTGMNRKIYRMRTGTAYYLVDTIDDDTTTTYTDNKTNDEVEISSGLLEIDNNQPPDATIVYEHKGYMFYVSATYPSRLYFSKVYGTNADYPQAAYEQVPTTNWKEHPSPILGLRSYENKLIVTGQDFTGFWTGSIWGGTNDNTAWHLIDNIGGVSHEAMTICQTSEGAICAMVTETGVRTFYPALYEEGLQRLPLSYDIQPLFDAGNLDNAWCQFYSSRLFVGFSYSEGTPVNYNNIVCVYDFKRGVWDAPWEFNISQAVIYNNLLYGGGSDIGKVYEMLSGYTNDGEAINMICDLRGDTGKYEASIQKLKIHVKNTSVTDNLTIGMQVDSSTLSKTPTRWRNSASSYGNQNLMETTLSIKRRGSFYGIRISDNSTNPIEINKIFVDYEGIKE